MDEQKLLMTRIPPAYSLWKAAPDVAHLVRSGADARRLLRPVLFNLRGIIAPTLVADADIEGLYAKLAHWDDPATLHEALADIARVRERIEDFNRSHGLRRLRFPTAVIDTVVALDFATIFLAAIFHAVRWRIEELGGAPGDVTTAGETAEQAAAAAAGAETPQAA